MALIVLERVAPLQAVAMASSLVGAGAVVAWRMREGRSPMTVPKLLIPPLGMSTGLAMFAWPPARVPLTWAVLALALGALVLALPMVHTSRLEISDGQIFVRRSAAFLWVLLGLVVVRLATRVYVEQYLSLFQTGALFYLLAFGMVVRWRLGMFMEYRRLEARLRS